MTSKSRASAQNGEVLWVNLFGGLRHHEMLRAMTYDRNQDPSQKHLEKTEKDKERTMKRLIIPATLIAGCWHIRRARAHGRCHGTRRPPANDAHRQHPIGT